MPELPEVETIAKNLREGNGSPPIPGHRIVSFSTDWPRLLVQGVTLEHLLMLALEYL